MKLHDRVDHQEHGDRDERIKAHEYRAEARVLVHDGGLDLGAAQIDADAHRDGRST
jgi:hypothetical protein